jgi:hypothetical protein
LCRTAGIPRIYCVPSGMLRLQLTGWHSRCGVRADRYLADWFAGSGERALGVYATGVRNKAERDAAVAALWGLRALAGEMPGADRWLDRTSIQN